MRSPAELLSRLRPVRSLRFEARSDTATGWDGVGVGSVAVTEPATGVMVFHETGWWTPTASPATSFDFRNTYRWTVVGDVVRLEHLRFGAEQPVLLFDITPGEDGRWRDMSPHLCREDCYSASLVADGGPMELEWTIVGPQKRVHIRYVYW